MSPPRRLGPHESPEFCAAWDAHKAERVPQFNGRRDAYAQVYHWRDGEVAELRDLLKRRLHIIKADALMMADITRHSPLDPESQAKHDSTEYESEKLIDELGQKGLK